MRTMLGTFMSVMVLAFLLAMPAMAQERIATVDMGRVFDKYWKKKEAEAAILQRAEEWKKRLKDLMDDYKKIQEDYVKLRDSANDQSVTPAERDKRKNQAED